MGAGMEKKDVLAGLAALAQETRLDIFRLLVEAGPEGRSAGAIAEALAVAPATLSFHLSNLTHAGLIVQRRLGRQLIYSAEYAAMNALLAYLTENCCGRGDTHGVACDPAGVAAAGNDAAPARSPGC
jgi:DNA-binding transcriptional ArsR family regulator